MAARVLVGSREQFTNDRWTFSWQCPNCCKVQRTEDGRQICRGCRKGVVVVTPDTTRRTEKTCKVCGKIEPRCFCDSPF